MSLLGTRDRFKEAPWYNPDQQVTIGGLGSIGSWLTLFMGRLVNKIYVYDYDLVEAHNLGGQFYGVPHVEDRKELSTKNIASCYNPQTKIITRGEFKENGAVTPISFSCFDNMKARKYMFENWRKKENKEVFIDGRLSAEQLWVYVVSDEQRADMYESEYLFSDDDIDPLPCSFKSTTHISSMIASYMTVMFTNYCYNISIEDVRDLPFETTFTASMVMQTTK